MPSLIERVSEAYKAFREGPDPIEVADADPSRLFSGSPVTPYNPSILIQHKGMRIFDSMRQDEQVKAALTFKKHAVISAGWEVVSPKDQPDDWEPTEFVREQLEGIMSLDRKLLQILTALDYGYSVTEKLWAPVDGRVNLVDLKTRRPHSFEFKQDEFGNIEALLQDQGPNSRGRMEGYSSMRGLGYLTPLPIEKFIIYTHQEEFQNPYGCSDLEAAYRAWWIKENTHKWLSMGLERFGIPPIFAKYNRNQYTGAEVEKLKTMLKSIATNTVGVVGVIDEDSLDFWSPEQLGQQAADVFIKALDKFDEHIARAILMPGLLGVSPEQVTGSHARARVVFDVFMFVVDQLRENLEAQIMQPLVNEIVDLNFPGQTDYPQWRLMPLSEDDVAEKFSLWKDLLESKAVRKGEDDEAHIRTALDMPEYTEMEEEEEPVPPMMPPPMPPSPDRPEADPEADEFKAFRQMNNPEKAVNFRQIERNMDALEAEFLETGKDILRIARDTIVMRYKRNPEEFELDALPSSGALRRLIRAYLKGMYQEGRKDLSAELSKSESDVKTFAASDMPSDAEKFLRDKAKALADAKDAEIVAAVKQSIIAGVQNGEDPAQVVRRIEESFLPFLGDQTTVRDGEDLKPYRLETIARTEATTAYNQGRLIQASQNARLMKGMMYSAILDGRTTVVCRNLDGKIFRITDPALRSLRPPRHYNCRSILVPVTISQTVDEADYVTPAQAGSAKEESGKGF